MRTIFSGLILMFSLVLAGWAQSGYVIPQGGAGHSDQASCLIVKRMGPADQVTSYLYSFGIRGKQFQYIEGKYPQGFPFHGRLTDHDVRDLQGRGAEIIVLEQAYTADNLKEARAQCVKMTGKTPDQAEETKAVAVSQDRKLANSDAVLEITSDPTGADIDVDGSFVGNTPSSIGASAGEHTIKLSKSGYAQWERKIKVTAGNIKLSPTLQSAATASPAK